MRDEKKDVLVILLKCESNGSKIKSYAQITYFSRDDSGIAGDRYRRCSIFFRMLGMEMRIAFVLS